MRITLAQITCREGDIAHNLAAVLAQIERCNSPLAERPMA
ncbi:putative amidohydrolase [Serratia sp. 509]